VGSFPPVFLFSQMEALLHAGSRCLPTTGDFIKVVVRLVLKNLGCIIFTFISDLKISLLKYKKVVYVCRHKKK
jgi:hypothetical protein